MRKKKQVFVYALMLGMCLIGQGSAQAVEVFFFCREKDKKPTGQGSAQAVDVTLNTLTHTHTHTHTHSLTHSLTHSHTHLHACMHTLAVG